ncbi:Ff.00g132270.m01.CDS01 [Fusarium sp. VM40]|nr:Ff.00g132270.m01.CDS01 [Fusarium sp. VM40]
MAKPRAKNKSTFPSLNDADFSRADADQAALARVKKIWDKNAAGWPDDVQATVLRLCKLAKRTPSNSNTPSSHKIWKDQPWNFGHWVVMNSIYDPAKLANMKNKLRDTFPGVNFDAMVGPGKPTKKSSKSDKDGDDTSSDDTSSDDKISDDKISDDKISDNKISDDKISDNKISDDEISKGEENISVTAEKQASRAEDAELTKKLLEAIATGTQSTVADTKSTVVDKKNDQALPTPAPQDQALLSLIQKEFFKAVADTRSAVATKKIDQALPSTPQKQSSRSTDDKHTQSDSKGQTRKRSQASDFVNDTGSNSSSSKEGQKISKKPRKSKRLKKHKKLKRNEITVSPTPSSSRLKKQENATAEAGSGSLVVDGGQETHREIKNELEGNDQQSRAPGYHLGHHQQSITPQQTMIPQQSMMSQQPMMPQQYPPQAQGYWGGWNRDYNHTLPYSGNPYFQGGAYHGGNHEPTSMMDTRNPYSVRSSPAPRHADYARHSIEGRDRQMSVTPARMDDSESVAVAQLRKEMNVKFEAQEQRHFEAMLNLRTSLEGSIESLATELRELENRVERIEQRSTGV